jgi:hypothetical protein
MSEDDRKEVWKSILTELEEGWVEEVARQDLPANTVYFSRFVAWQLKANKPGWFWKPRCCDNGRSNRINDATVIRTPIRDMPTIDMQAAVSNCFARSRTRRNAKDGKTGEKHRRFAHILMDMSAAYRQLLGNNDKVFRVIYVVDNEGRERFFLMHRLTFGEASSVSNYNLHARTLCMLVRKALLLPMLHFFDDFSTPIPEHLREKAVKALHGLLEDLLEAKFNEEKCVSGEEVAYLGLLIKLTAEGFHVRLHENRRAKLLYYVEQHLQVNGMTGTEAAALAGRLSFAGNAMFGRLGRTYLYPIFSRANAVQPHLKLNFQLRQALAWWRDLLRRPDVAWSRFAPVTHSDREKWIVYTDASKIGKSVVALKVEKGAVSRVYHSAVAFPCRSEEDIKQLEDQCLAAVFHTVPQGVCQALILLMVDNVATQTAMTRGLGPYAGECWHAAATRGCAMWCERVCSGDNTADDSSRQLPIPRFLRKAGTLKPLLKVVSYYVRFPSSLQPMKHLGVQNHEVPFPGKGGPPQMFPHGGKPW